MSALGDGFPLPALPGEQPLKTGRANLQRGAEAVGGTLHLTTHRLMFTSHALNFQRGETVIPLETIASVTPAWTKFLGTIPLFPNSILITGRDGQSQSAVVAGRKDWIAAIERARRGDAYSGGH